MAIKRRFCWNCGADMGEIEDWAYERTDTCGAPACEREAQYACEAEETERRERAEQDDYERY
jgi:hypothetical protein